MAKNHFKGSLQNLGICSKKENSVFKKEHPVFKKGNPVFKKGNSVFKKGNPASKGQGWPSGDLRGKCCFSIAKISINEKRDRLACTRRA